MDPVFTEEQLNRMSREDMLSLLKIMQEHRCNLRRAAATGAFASGHSAEHNGHLY